MPPGSLAAQVLMAFWTSSNRRTTVDERTPATSLFRNKRTVFRECNPAFCHESISRSRTWAYAHTTSYARDVTTLSGYRLMGDYDALTHESDRMTP